MFEHIQQLLYQVDSFIIQFHRANGNWIVQLPNSLLNLRLSKGSHEERVLLLDVDLLHRHGKDLFYHVETAEAGKELQNEVAEAA